jgi:hypothetical protein
LGWLTFVQKSAFQTKGVAWKASQQALSALFAFESFVDPAQADVVTQPACCIHCFNELRAPNFVMQCEFKAGNQSCTLCLQKKRACRAVRFWHFLSSLPLCQLIYYFRQLWQDLKPYAHFVLDGSADIRMRSVLLPTLQNVLQPIMAAEKSKKSSARPGYIDPCALP